MTVEYAPGWPELFVWTIYVGFVVAFLVAFGMGANDCANSYGTVVGAKVLKLWQAYVLATVFETLGAGLLGYKVTDTMRKSIVNVSIYDVYSQADLNGTYRLVEACNETNSSLYFNTSDCTKYTDAQFMVGELGALIGTAFWLIFATVVHLPVSTTHSAVGATIGFSLVSKGPQGINWKTIINITISWVASPVLTGICAVSFYLIIKYTVFNRTHPFDASLQMLPVFYFFALLVNTFSILYQGSKYLMFDKLDWWIDLLISLFVATSVATVMYFWGKHVIRKRVLGKRIPLPTVVQKPCLRTSTAPTPRAPPPQAAPSQAAPKITITEDGSTTNIELKEKAAEARVINGDSGFQPTPSRLSTKFTTRNASSITLSQMAENVPSNTPAVFKTMNMVDAKSLKEKLKALKHPVEEHPLAQQVFNYLQIMSACFLSFSHGSNDTANAVGPLVGLWLVYKNGHALVDAGYDTTMLYLILFGAGCMILGLWVLGHKVISTIGTKITLVTPPSGFSMELGTAFTVLVASKMGIPISTTHCMVGAVVAVGWVKSSEGGVSWKVFRNIALAWVVTLPVAGAVAAFATWLLNTYAL